MRIAVRQCMNDIGSTAGDSLASLESLPTRTESGDFLAVVEASQGTRHKFKYRADWCALELSGVLPLGTSFPYDFGFLPSTLGDDGDPLDVLLFADEPLPPGVVVPCRIVGVIEAEQREAGQPAERNDRLLAVALKSHRYGECRSLDGLAANALDEIERFFVFYNAQKGVRFTPIGRRGKADAERSIAEGMQRRVERFAEPGRPRDPSGE